MSSGTECADLRYAAARFHLGLARTDQLVTVAHAALDRGVYTRGFGEIVTTRDPTLSEVGPHFAWAMRELGVQIADRSEAIDTISHHDMAQLADGCETPQTIARQAYWDYDALRCDRRGKQRDLHVPGVLDEFSSAYYEYEYREELGNAEELESVDGRWIAFARNWLRDRWQPVFDPSWRPSAVVDLAATISAGRAVERLPVLADALRDAGCDTAAVLDHCRGAGRTPAGAGSSTSSSASREGVVDFRRALDPPARRASEGEPRPRTWLALAGASGW